MAFEFITEDNLKAAFEDAKKFMLPLHEPLDEFERIARNKPWPGIAKGLPKVTDGTLAALIQETPKRVIQQVPTGLVEAPDEWLELVANYILENEILPNNEEVAVLIQKCWAGVSKALTYGSQPAYVQFIKRGEYIGTDWGLPYIKDVLFEPGKLSDRDSNIMFLRSWWTKTQIQALIDKEQRIKRQAEEDGDAYETGWDLGMLQDLLDTGASQKDALQMTPNERNKQLNNGFFEIVHAFQRGVGNTFYSFAPKLPGDSNVVRKKKNEDPRGAIPIHFMYANIDFSNPLGRGSVEISGGMQNLLDSEVQTYQYMRTLMMDPPLEIRGNLSNVSLNYAPGERWRLGSDPNASVSPARLETASLNQFPQNYGLIKSQILNLNSSMDTSVSAEAGNPGFSKTDAGVKSNEARLGISDNYMRKQFESWFQDICETSLNLYFACQHGVQDLKLDEETAQKIEKLQPGTVQNNTIQIDYDSETPNLKFQVDASSSMKKDNADQLERATNVLDLTQKYPQLDSRQGGPIDVTELTDRIISMIGIEDAEKIVKKPEVDPQTGQPTEQQPQQPSMTPEMVQQMIQEALKQNDANDPNKDPLLATMKAVGLKFTDLDPTAQQSILEKLMLPSDGNTRSVIEADQRQQEIDLQAGQAEHQVANSSMDTALKGRELQLKIAQQAHSQRQGMADNALKTAQFQQSTENNNAQPIKQGAV